MATVTKLEPSYLIGLFVLYIVLHLAIGLALKHFKKKDEIATLTYDETRILKVLNFLMKWFPAIYVVVLLVVL